MKRIVITGGGGGMGTVMADGLRASGKYEIISTAHHPKEGRDEIPLDVYDLDACMEAFKGADMVIHMAFLLKINRIGSLQNNILGTYNIYEAARLCGVKRVIFGSSNHVFGFYPIDAKVGNYDEYRPDSLYGIGKCSAELIGRYYSDKFDISCFNIRIGHCRGVKRDDFKPGMREYNQWLSNSDLIQLIQCCIDADPKIMYKCLCGTSENSGNYWDISSLKEEIGYVPETDGTAMIQPDTINNMTPYKGGVYPFMRHQGRDSI